MSCVKKQAVENCVKAMWNKQEYKYETDLTEFGENWQKTYQRKIYEQFLRD